MTTQDAFWKLHENLPRQGPGSDETTRKLFDVANSSSKLHKAIDMGCGPGRSTLQLASLGLVVTAIDTHQAFLDELYQNAKDKGLLDRIVIENTSMQDPPYSDKSFDLIWAEGTAYIIDWKNALTNWKRLLQPGGKLVATDSFWLTKERSPEVAKFWEADPLMMTVPEAQQIAEEAGYSVEYIYEQPDTDWFAEYYDPLTEKVKLFENNSDPATKETIDMTKLEIQIRKKFPSEYGHVGFVLTV